MNGLNNKNIKLEKNIDIIQNANIISVTNDLDTYILIFSKQFTMIKIYMSLEEIDKIFKDNKDKSLIDLTKFRDKLFIVKDGRELPFEK